MGDRRDPETPTNYTLRNRDTERRADSQGCCPLCPGPKGLRLEMEGKVTALVLPSRGVPQRPPSSAGFLLRTVLRITPSAEGANSTGSGATA